MDKQFNLLLKSGHVIDPANQIDEVMDVAVCDGKIAAVDHNICADTAQTVVDATDNYLIPGLIDIHTHVYPELPRRANTLLTIDADAHMLKDGCTTVVDAGTVGWKDFGFFMEQVVEKSTTRVLALVNIASRGMLDMKLEQEPSTYDVKMAAAIADSFPDVCVGIKAAHYWPGWGSRVNLFDEKHPCWASTDAGVAAGELCGKPVMLDFQPNFCGPGEETQNYPDLICKKLRPGDIHTHVFAQQFPTVDANGKVYDHMWEARKRGVFFDLGHGAGSFWFRNAKRALDDGFVPDSISTDLHLANIHGVVLSMLNTVAKYHAMGLPLKECIYRATVAPARIIHRPDLGHLSVGSCADIAVIRKIKGNFGYVDCGNAKLASDFKFDCAMTIRAGKIVHDAYGMSMPEWTEAPASYWLPEIRVK